MQFTGPHYETPAEVRMAGILGGDLVGMSTALETIAARQSGLEVLGISLVTNLPPASPTPRSTTRRCSRPAATRPSARVACSPPSSRGSEGVVPDAVVAPLADLLAAARAWAADDPDAVTRAEVEARGRRRVG